MYRSATFFYSVKDSSRWIYITILNIIRIIFAVIIEICSSDAYVVDVEY